MSRGAASRRTSQVPARRDDPAVAGAARGRARLWDRLLHDRVEQCPPRRDAAGPQICIPISAADSRWHVDLLCDTFGNADDDGRQLIRMMAELSISKAEGVPTRRYMP